MVNKMKILKMMMLISPVSKDWGDRQTDPFVLLTEENPDNVVNTLGIFEPTLFTSGDPIELILEKLKVNYSDGTFFYFDGSEKSKSYIRQITTALKTDRAAGGRINSTFVVISSVPLETGGFHLEYSPCIRADLRISDYIPSVDSIGWAENIANQLNRDKTGNIALLYDAVAMFYPRLKEKRELDEFRVLTAVIKQLEEHNRQMMDTEGIVRIFGFSLLKWIDANCDISFVKLPKVTESALKDKEHLIFYDLNSIYISNKLFSKITASIRNLFSTNTLKRLLADAGVIESTSRGYTAKMFVQCKNGKVFRPEMIKIHRNTITFTSELSIDDFIKAGELDENYSW